MIIIAFLVGVFIGCSVSLSIIASMVVKSNDFGNSKGNFIDFSKTTIHIISKQDRIRKPNI